MITLSPDAITEQLATFTGSLTTYRYNGDLLLTEGVNWLASEVGTCWLLNLIIAARKVKRVKTETFQVYVLVVDHNTRSACLKVQDGDGETLHTIHLAYTDFPLDELTLWVMDGVVLLPGEY